MYKRLDEPGFKKAIQMIYEDIRKKTSTTSFGRMRVGNGLSVVDGVVSGTPLGTTPGTALEGSKLAETLGIPYGGILNNSNSKIAGTAYYDTTTKKTYKCLETTSLNYAESTKFEPISNNDLLSKLQNLDKKILVFRDINSTEFSNDLLTQYSFGIINTIPSVYSSSIVIIKNQTTHLHDHAGDFVMAQTDVEWANNNIKLTDTSRFGFKINEIILII